MEEIIHNFFEVIIQISPYIVVWGVFSYITSVQKKRVKEQENKEKVLLKRTMWLKQRKY